MMAEFVNAIADHGGEGDALTATAVAFPRIEQFFAISLIGRVVAPAR